MVSLNQTTEEKILEAAKSVFLTKGIDGARMQEIADIAGINKALLHYYFRCKEKLFEEVVKKTASTFFPELIGVLSSEIPFEVKIWSAVEKYISFLQANPYVPVFIINTINNSPESITGIFDNNLMNFDKLQTILDVEYTEGNITKKDSKHFILNLISLCVFPFVSKPVFQKVFNLTETDFEMIMEERKKVVPMVLMSWLKS